MDEKGRLVDVWLKVALYRAAPELERASAGTRGDGASFESLGAKGVEEAAAAPGVPVNGQLKTTRYGVIDMAKQVLVGLRCAITVSVDQDAPPEAAGTVELTLRAWEWPLNVVAELWPPDPEDFQVVGPTELRILVPNSGNSTPAQFHVIPLSPGEKKLQIQFTLDSIFLGVVEVTTTAVTQFAGERERAAVEGSLIIRDVGSRPDFAIWMKGRNLHYRLEVAIKGRGRLVDAVVDYDTPPQKYMRDEYNQLNALAGQAAGNDDELATIGYNLYRQLFKSDLRAFDDFYWRLMRPSAPANAPAPTVQVVSDEPAVSWELLRAYDQRTQDDLHFCERFGLVRWLADPAAPPTVGLLKARRMVMVAPQSNLDNVTLERQELRALAGEFGIDFRVLTTLDELKALLRDGDADILHIACHGKHAPEQPDRSVLRIGDDDLQPRDIIAPLVRWNGKQRGEAQARPLVFLNACQSGQQSASFTTLDGWAARFITEAGAGFFVGSTWNATDALAARFAPAFYRAALSGLPVAEALRKAREQIKAIKKMNPQLAADGTHLSYTLFGDPNARIEGGRHG